MRFETALDYQTHRRNVQPKLYNERRLREQPATSRAGQSISRFFRLNLPSNLRSGCASGSVSTASSKAGQLAQNTAREHVSGEDIATGNFKKQI